jgi:large subunit ribosomal protein L23
MTPEQIIKRPLILTEKGQQLREAENKYLFEVDRRANKVQIRKAIKALYGVDATEVNTMIVRGRLRRMGRGSAKTQNWKKAIIRVAAGESIDFYEES